MPVIPIQSLALAHKFSNKSTVIPSKYSQLGPPFLSFNFLFLTCYNYTDIQFKS